MSDDLETTPRADRLRQPRLLHELSTRLTELTVYDTRSVDDNRRLMVDSTLTPPPQPGVTLVHSDETAEYRWRLHQPEREGSAGVHAVGAIIHIHGGGFIMGSAELYDGVCARLAALTGMAVFSIDYRLAPEHPYPAALDDCEDAVRTIIGDAERHGVLPGTVGIYGESAGAALAVGVIARLREAGEPLPAFLVLQEPSLDDRMASISSRVSANAPLWTRELAVWTWSLYLGSQGGNPPAEAAPARLESVADFPATFISTRDHDPLRDEGLDFARRLIDAGVPTELRHYPGTFHGCASIENTEVGARILHDASDFARRAVTRPWG